MDEPSAQTDPGWQDQIEDALLDLAVSLSVYDPDHPLHDSVMKPGHRGSELSPMSASPWETGYGNNILVCTSTRGAV